MNAYEYAGNNPLNHMDPVGLQSTKHLLNLENFDVKKMSEEEFNEQPEHVRRQWREISEEDYDTAVDIRAKMSPRGVGRTGNRPIKSVVDVWDELTDDQREMYDRMVLREAVERASTGDFQKAGKGAHWDFAVGGTTYRLFKQDALEIGITIPTMAATGYAAAYALGATGAIGRGAVYNYVIGSGVPQAGYAAIGSTGQVGQMALRGLGGAPQQGFKTSLGRRVVDQLVNGIAHESKVGYRKWSTSLATQIAKDAELIRSKDVAGAVWHFFRSPTTGKIGADPRVLEKLATEGIKYVIH